MNAKADAQTAVTTIVLSTFNGDAFLAQQLNSLYEQSYENVKILVRDDGSSDSTRDILARAHADAHIELLASNANIGAAQSFFELLKHAATTTTKYVAFCDQDDVWRNDKISRAVAALSAAREGTAAMYCSRLEIVDADLASIGFTALPDRIGFGNALVENVCIGCTIVLNRRAIELLSQSVPAEVLVHDWWCYLVLSCFGEIIFDTEATIKYRQHEGNAFGIAVGKWKKLARSLQRFFGDGGGRHWQSAQAATFLAAFADRIPAAPQRVLKEFIEAKSSWRARLSLALSNDIWRQKRFDDMAWRMLILMNRY